MKCHVVLWIPTLVYTVFDKPLKTVEEVNISDVRGSVLIVKVKLENEGDFSVSVKEGENYKEIVFLERELTSSNGLISFTYKSTQDKDTGFRFTTSLFPPVIYHLIKGFYHIHDFHESETDSSFPPYVTGKKVNIKDNDNAALQHYLKTYSTFISNSVDNVQYAIRNVRGDKKLIKPDSQGLVQKLCLIARGYEVYMGVLYRSRYNTICKTNSSDREWRHIACNIENGLNFIRTIELEYREYSQEVFVKKVKRDSFLTFIIGIVSLMIGVYSIGKAIQSANKSSAELQDVKQSLKEEMLAIPNDISSIKSKIDTLSYSSQQIEEAITELTKRQRAIERALENN